MSILEKYTGVGEKWISQDNDKLQYSGRMDFEYEGGPLWVYPCSYVKIRFVGRKIKALMTNQKSYWKSEIGWILDGKEGKAVLADEKATVFTIAEDLGDGEHELCLYKRMDACHRVVFHGFIVDDGFTLLEAPSKPARRMEVFGDSVSAGEVSEAVDCCGQPDPEHNGEYSNSYYSYAWLTARALGAELHDIAQGGVALMDNTGYYNMPDTKGMEWIYDKIQYQPEEGGSKLWDFSKYTPHVVILAFGQNDNHPENVMEDFEGDKAKQWRMRYGAFVKKLRELYPKAHIICKTTILCHDFSWDRAIETVVSELQDEQVHYFKYSNNSVGTPGHIRRPEAEKMAEELSAYIEVLDEKWHFFEE